MKLPTSVMESLQSKVEAKLGARAAIRLPKIRKSAQDSSVVPPVVPVVPPAQEAPQQQPIQSSAGAEGVPPAGPPQAAPGTAPPPTAAVVEAPPATPPPVDVSQLGAVNALQNLPATTGGGGFNPYTRALAGGRPTQGGSDPSEDNMMNLVSQVQEMAFREKQAQYLAETPERNLSPAEEGGPLSGAANKLRRISNRDAGVLPAAGGLAAGFFGGREAVKALERRLPESVAGNISKRVGAKVTAQEVPGILRSLGYGKGGTAAAKGLLPWYGRMEMGLRRPLVRGGVRWGLRAGALGAGLLGAKALFGKDKEGAEKKAQEDEGNFLTRHPYMTAAGGGLAGALAAPLLARGVRALGIESPDMSATGAIAGAGAGILATHLARKRMEREQLKKRRTDTMRLRQQGIPFGA